ncbi:hypothetical protein [Pseudomonas phage Itty13]|uniref:DUF1643 domain-containing protein n=1 Tax=Pseudomonas phage Itty13 TaxID=2805750 RepID=A0A889IQK3_9CAUD|nr:hypothetical protein PQC19_gp76 [Pseudomonas phage Itty13]QRE00652.1 hypothetical protein [Pseudomonas phage Itty13]
MSAIISECGRYRYRLERETGVAGPVVAFIGVNPSTADATEDDATIRKMVGFARRWGYSRVIVGNLFAYRATDVRELRRAYLDPFETRPLFAIESRYLLDIIRNADLLVPCWGDRGKIPKVLRDRPSDVLHLLRHPAKPICHLGLTKRGDPKHPLMLGYDTQLVEWRA